MYFSWTQKRVKIALKFFNYNSFLSNVLEINRIALAPNLWQMLIFSMTEMVSCIDKEAQVNRSNKHHCVMRMLTFLFQWINFPPCKFSFNLHEFQIFIMHDLYYFHNNAKYNHIWDTFTFSIVIWCFLIQLHVLKQFLVSN